MTKSTENQPQLARERDDAEGAYVRFLIEEAESVAVALERMAESIRQSSIRGIDSVDALPGGRYSAIAGEIQHNVTWGVANLALNTLTRTATEADILRHARTTAEGDDA